LLGRSGARSGPVGPDRARPDQPRWGGQPKVVATPRPTYLPRGRRNHVHRATCSALAVRGLISYDSRIETLTFLSTDIEGSTAVLRRVGDATYASVLAEHHRIIRLCLEAHGGREEGTQGDSFFATFTSPRAGVACGVEIQQTLSGFSWPGDEQLRVRMGLHTGEASDAATGLVGYEIHRAARIAAVGHGGQILLSSAAAGLVDDSLPRGSTLRNLGPHRLKDLGRPETIFQLLAPGLEADFPPLRSLDNPELPNNLPASLTTFIGRASELDEIRTLVRSSRLVTLTGAGGSGKTRLALQVAADFLDGSGEGVWLAELASVSNPDRTADAIIDALQIRHEAGLAPIDNLLRVLRDQRSLVILDNCEHLVDSVAKIVDQLGRSCPKIHLIVTSREPLGVDGEEVYRVRSLSLPAGEVETLADVSGSDSVDLFVARTRQHDKSFELSQSNVSLVASICRRLDGIPLAIELAAARLSSMSVEDLHNRLDKRFRLLAGGSRSALPRQQTLGAMVAWSYDLLNELERAVLRRLTVFVNGFDLQAAESVCAAEFLEPFEVADIIGSLVDKSLVAAERGDSSLRYRLLETIRQFAADRLLDVDGERAMYELRTLHAEYFLNLCEMAEPILKGHSDQAQWLDRLEGEWENFQAAFSHFSSDPSGAESVMRLGVSGFVFFQVRMHREAAGFVRDALAGEPDVSPSIRARALMLRAESIGLDIESVEVAEGRLREVLELYGQALELARAAGDVDVIVRVLSRMGFWTNDSGDTDAARRLVDEALDLAHGAQVPGLVGMALMYKGFIQPFGEGKSTMLEAAAWLRRAEDSATLCMALLVASVRDSVTVEDLREDRELNAEALRLAEEVGYVAVKTLLLGNLGCYCFYLGEKAEAVGYLRRALQMIHRAGWPEYWLSGYAEVLAWLAADEGDFLASAQLVGANARLHSEAPEFFLRNRQTGKNDLVRSIEDDARRRSIEALGQGAYEHAIGVGEALTTSQFLDLALGRSNARP
jgi:predicted ATPase/class 3 adenylate cyclase